MSLHPSLHAPAFFVKEQVGMFRAANHYDIFDPVTGQQVLACREPHLGLFSKLFRFTDYKRMTPFHIEIRDMQGQLLLSVQRGVSLLRSRVEVRDGEGRLIGGFQQKLLSIGGKFDVLDAGGLTVCTLQGKWTSWDFRFLQGSTELAAVTKKWAGLGKELFTSADNYMLSISPAVPADDPKRLLILAAVMCIDMVLKE